MCPRPSKHTGSATSAALCTILSLALLLTAAAAAPLEAQETVRPGHPSLRLDRLQPGTDSLRVWRITGDDRRRGPLQIQSIERITRGGEELLRLAFTLESERGNLYDTTTFRLPSLAPVRHVSRPDPGGPWRTLEVRYGDGIVEGTVTPPDSASRSLEATLEAPVFDPGVGQILLAILPLAAGYEARVPMFSHEALEAELYTYRVIGEGVAVFRGDTVDIWKVEMSLPSGRSFDTTVEKSTGRFVRGETRLGPDMRVVTEPPSS